MSDLIGNARVSRKQFLRVVGLAAGSAVLSPLLAAAKPAGDLPLIGCSRFYRGTSDGRLLGSMDGRKWAELANFGPHLAVREVRLAREGWLHAVMAAGENEFVLKSRDGKTWYTLDYVVPGKA
ncbi:MAG: hypothetical protein GX491_01685 [Chloroflexi bacterium]|nr:hypothetical protein [Chloroflexota bacterium]